MENLKDFINNIRERFSNPLIFSFIWSWLIINWKITIALIWCDSDQISKYGNNSIFSFIEQNLSIYHSLCLPLTFAISYIIFNPLLKNLISAFNTWSLKWGENWNLKIINEGYISINKYLNLRKENEAKTNELMEIINKESTYLDRYKSLEHEHQLLKNDYNDLRLESFKANEFVDKLYDRRILNGTWEKTLKINPNQTIKETITIDNTRYYLFDQYSTKIYKYNINDFTYDIRNQKIFFIKEIVNNTEFDESKEGKILVNRLQFEGNDLLTGTENNIEVTYKRR